MKEVSPGHKMTHQGLVTQGGDHRTWKLKEFKVIVSCTPSPWPPTQPQKTASNNSSPNQPDNKNPLDTFLVTTHSVSK